MRTTTWRRIKYGGLALTIVIQITVYVYLRGNKWSKNVRDQDFSKNEEEIVNSRPKTDSMLKNRPITGKCLKRGDIDLIVSYTLWGNVMMPVHTISCSIRKPAGQKFQIIPQRFFQKHPEEKPMIRFTSSKKETKYALLLLQSTSTKETMEINEENSSYIHWFVFNINGENLIDGMYKWEDTKLSETIIKYKAPLTELAEGYYQFVLFKQKEMIEMNNNQSTSIVGDLDGFLQEKGFMHIASAGFLTNHPT